MGHEASSNTEGITRRRFIGSSAGTVGALALGGSAALTRTASAADISSIEHVVVVMMENRSFDHFLGWVPGTDGRQAGLTYTDAAGVPHATHPLAPD
jgi:phospholipase C